MSPTEEFYAWARNLADPIVRLVQKSPFYVKYAVFYRWRRMIEGANLKPSDQVIDLGGGIGYISRFCADAGHRVVHVDADRKFMEKAISQVHRS